jgi:hypothetical protein
VFLSAERFPFPQLSVPPIANFRRLRSANNFPSTTSLACAALCSPRVFNQPLATHCLPDTPALPVDLGCRIFRSFLTDATPQHLCRKPVHLCHRHGSADYPDADQASFISQPNRKFVASPGRSSTNSFASRIVIGTKRSRRSSPAARISHLILWSP